MVNYDAVELEWQGCWEDCFEVVVKRCVAVAVVEQFVAVVVERYETVLPHASHYLAQEDLA